MHVADTSPSPFIADHLRHVPQSGAVLDLACGGGRHTRLARLLGHPVLAVDRDISAVVQIASVDTGIEVLRADLEAAPWPLKDRKFAGVIVSNYLWRPLLPAILNAVALGGVLLYETFAVGNERFGRPRNKDFLLRDGELRDHVVGQFLIVHYEHGHEGDPVRSVRQRICAVRQH
ncbi:MAG: class I SAM-dependent methyltransferase [Planctomycetota bacterium]|nr:class I SAM-dependent methyltransferase [Planctomycetota bacterium]